MQRLDAEGQKLSAMLFIRAFAEARKLAPPRYLALRLTPDLYKALLSVAEAPEVIQLGRAPGRPGQTVLKVNCVKPPFGIGDGIEIQAADDAAAGTLQFLLHGIAEFEVVNLG